MKKVSFIAIAIFLFLTSSTLFAQTSFNGTWKFMGQESVSGTLYLNGSPAIVVIVINGSDQKMDYVTKNQDGNDTSSETFSGGQPYEAKTALCRKKIISLTWSADKKSFTETSNIYSLTDATKLDGKNTDVWTLNNDELVLDRKSENYLNGETWESKSTYEKQ